MNTSVVKPQQGSSNSCLALTGLPNACNLPSNFATNYNLNGLYNKGANGSGQTLAIVTLAAVDPGAPQYFWATSRTSRAPAARSPCRTSMAVRARRATPRARARPTWTSSSPGRWRPAPT